MTMNALACVFRFPCRLLLAPTLPVVAATVVPGDELPGTAQKPSGTTDETTMTEEQQRSFVRDKVLPLLQTRCLQCHGETDDVRGGLLLLSRETMLRGGDSGPVLVPHRPEDSLLISAVRYESFEMPPRNRLPEGEVLILEQWIRMGAPWPEDLSPQKPISERVDFPLWERRESHWAWQPIRTQEVPRDVKILQAAADETAVTDIDWFVRQHLQVAGLSAAEPTDRRALIRRIHFDLTGLPPTIDQLEQFYTDPADLMTAVSTVVDELLQSPQFGERWARHWLDLVRYAETLGHEFDYPLPHAWRYRDYVIRPLNADVPYDQLILEHVAGDLLPSPRRHPQDDFNESIIGTGFWFLHEDKHAPVDVRGEETASVDNQIDVFSKAFMGLTIACARCHDHKFDAISTQDYYALAGFLKSSRRRIEHLDPGRQIEQASRQIQSIRDSAVEQLPALLGLLFRQPDADSVVTQQMRKMLLRDDSLRPDHPLSLAAQLFRAESEGRPLTDEARQNVLADWCRRL